jgi:NADH:ubiquinone oxidoreductase subunit 3 (subunit A)
LRGFERLTAPPPGAIHRPPAAPAITSRHRQEVRVQNGVGYLYAAIYFAVGCVFVLGALGAANVLNALLLKRRPAKDKLVTYESGETPIGSAWVQYPLAFYIFALLFVAFDVDIVFILSWAVIFQQLSWFGFIEILFFILVLAMGLVYAWRKGVIRWI